MALPSRLLTATLPLALLASTASARQPRTLKLRFPRLSIPAVTNPEACLLVRVPTTTPFDVASIEIRHRGVRGSFAVQHFLVHLYTGEPLGRGRLAGRARGGRVDRGAGGGPAGRVGPGPAGRTGYRRVCPHGDRADAQAGALPRRRPDRRRWHGREPGRRSAEPLRARAQ